MWKGSESAKTELSWANDRLVRLVVPGATVDGAVITDPLLGPAHAIDREVLYRSLGRTASRAPDRLTTMSALDWARPSELPTVAAPGKLPPGSGGAILNAIAELARRAGVVALRYAGPYPTPALWRALARSFTTTASEAEFTPDLLARAARVARDPIAIDFAPAPHDRVVHAHGHSELREGMIERAMIDGITYAPAGSPARLVEQRCEIWFGDAPYAHVATLAGDGTLAAGPHAIPACASDVTGKPFPPPLAAALGELVGDVVPALLAEDARALVASQPLRWADLGARAARADDHGLAVHAALWERIAPLGLPRLALALAEALAPVVTSALIRRLM